MNSFSWYFAYLYTATGKTRPWGHHSKFLDLNSCVHTTQTCTPNLLSLSAVFSFHWRTLYLLLFQPAQNTQQHSGVWKGTLKCPDIKTHLQTARVNSLEQLFPETNPSGFTSPCFYQMLLFPTWFYLPVHKEPSTGVRKTVLLLTVLLMKQCLNRLSDGSLWKLELVSASLECLCFCTKSNITPQEEKQTSTD